MKLPDKHEIQWIISNYSSDTESDKFMKLYGNAQLNNILF